MSVVAQRSDLNTPEPSFHLPTSLASLLRLLHALSYNIIDKRLILRISNLEEILKVSTSIPNRSWTHICNISNKWVSSPTLNTLWHGDSQIPIPWTTLLVYKDILKQTFWFFLPTSPGSIPLYRTEWIHLTLNMSSEIWRQQCPKPSLRQRNPYFFSWHFKDLWY